jgi:hypothetical protein
MVCRIICLASVWSLEGNGEKIVLDVVRLYPWFCSGIVRIHNTILYIPTIPGVHNRVNDDHKLDTAKSDTSSSSIKSMWRSEVDPTVGKQVLVLAKQAGRTERVSSSAPLETGFKLIVRH